MDIVRAADRRTIIRAFIPIVVVNCFSRQLSSRWRCHSSTCIEKSTPLSHTVRVVVFEHSADLARRIEDPSLNVTKDSVLVLKGTGPIGKRGMPEAKLIPISKKIALSGSETYCDSLMVGCQVRQEEPSCSISLQTPQCLTPHLE